HERPAAWADLVSCLALLVALKKQPVTLRYRRKFSSSSGRPSSNCEAYQFPFVRANRAGKNRRTEPTRFGKHRRKEVVRPCPSLFSGREGRLPVARRCSPI